MSPTYPLPTLAFQVTNEGISAPAFNDIFNSIVASVQGIYGSDTYLTPNTQDGQFLAIFAQAFSDSNQSAIAAYNGFRPAYAQGAGLSSLVQINGINRQDSSNSTVNVVITGVAGTPIVLGIVQDQLGNLWNLPGLVTIPNSGAITVTATAQADGNITALANTVNIRYTPVQGWQSVNNPAAATPGAPIESDANLRQRQTISPELTSVTPLEAILANVANVPGVTRYAIYENDTGTTDVNGVPGHSISLVVLGGDSTAIAQAIEANKSPGTGTYGTTSISVQDPAGLAITINFFVLTLVNIYVQMNVTPLAGWANTTALLIQTAVFNFINSIPIGDDVVLNWLLGAASLNGTPEALTFQINTLTFGTTPVPMGTSPVVIGFNQAASALLANMGLTVG